MLGAGQREGGPGGGGVNSRSCSRVPHALASVAAATDGGSASSAWWSDTVGYLEGDTPAWLLVAAPHSQSTFSILGNTGVALVVVAACVAATDRLPRFTRLAVPVAAVGMVSLTAYVVDVLAIWVVGMEEETLPALIALLAFIATAMLPSGRDGSGVARWSTCSTPRPASAATSSEHLACAAQSSAGAGVHFSSRRP